MKKIYKESYFNRRSWILENFDKLDLSLEETMLLLLIDFAKENHKTISYDFFMSKLNYDNSKIDKIIEKLVSKKFLIIKPSNSGVDFDIDGLFEYDFKQFDISEENDVIEIAETFLKRPLSASELQKISDLSNEFDNEKIVDAIRVAEAYRKNSISYVESILRNEKK